MCLDLAKFCHFGNNFLVFGHFNKLYLVFGNILNLLWQMFNAIGQIFIVVIGQKNQTNIAIWSQWSAPMVGVLGETLDELNLLIKGPRSDLNLCQSKIEIFVTFRAAKSADSLSDRNFFLTKLSLPPSSLLLLLHCYCCHSKRLCRQASQSVSQSGSISCVRVKN